MKSRNITWMNYAFRSMQSKEETQRSKRAHLSEMETQEGERPESAQRTFKADAIIDWILNKNTIIDTIITIIWYVIAFAIKRHWIDSKRLNHYDHSIDRSLDRSVYVMPPIAFALQRRQAKALSRWKSGSQQTCAQTVFARKILIK